MIRKGEAIIAIDPDIRDMYCCEVMCEGEENAGPLLCRVLYMVAYPRQHAAADSGVPEEHAPLACGAVARLCFTRRVSAEERSGSDYETSLERCLQEYRSRRQYLYDALKGVPPVCRQVPMPDALELEILQRHAGRQFPAARTPHDDP